MTEIHGLIPPKFAKLKDAFAQNFVSGPEGLTERGARFSVVRNGEVIVDMWGGTCDREGTIPFTQKTLTPVFSCTKAVTAVMIARLVDQGRLDYEAPVARLWPEFGQAGKDKITLGQLISHQGGLPGFSPPVDPVTWFTPQSVLDGLCLQAPLWKPGTASGYHPITIGYLLGEIFRRAEGRSLGTALRDDIAVPLGLDLMIGTPETEFHRISDMQKPSAPPNLGVIDSVKTAAFLDKGSSPAGRGSGDWRKMEIPSANGHATAEALALFMSILSCGGKFGGQTILSPQALSLLIRERISGQDRVLPFRLSWAAGLLRNKGLKIYGPNEKTLGHSGWGGSCLMADPDKNLSMAYVMNRQSPYLLGDPRPVGLINLAYGLL
jgi:CubicO group peptidase (beta-lactamase class C family)